MWLGSMPEEFLGTQYPTPVPKGEGAGASSSGFGGGPGSGHPPRIGVGLFSTVPALTLLRVPGEGREAPATAGQEASATRFPPAHRKKRDERGTASSEMRFQ